MSHNTPPIQPVGTERVKDLVARAIALPVADRPAFIVASCGNDAALEREVRELLAAHDAASGFLASPTSSANLTVFSRITEEAGTIIGPYKLLQSIGEGGFGTVFLAEQMRPMQRKVALKIIKLGMDTKQVVARFEQERQALALMDHPSIAKVLDAGATESGRPYFVMEYVKGEPIVAFCNNRKLTLKQRLELFQQVCMAVHHAHQKGIIHRDIKPNNVLVTVVDGDKPLPKVIDFGIAKATAGRLTDKTLFTEHKALIGTPE